ncbi:NAD(P)H-flavin reductase [Pseudidiomarina gelatinasegens]|jgi:aquacobalamin reductase/NAD(P)H-flavin reductase|uniref:NAD(P)H-flavin reductase n=1 Tax=Pseudidiomarina gelatinasegens TaxID=2487740 RepID=A0A443YYL5_9GAMM|nr:NAD(P)H-flavin reductase [Pseudidiomarina gelatinasegens]RWU09180.1 NAD(P)H-flavin reductase [Pseudidiomarina gelatinasegens]
MKELLCRVAAIENLTPSVFRVLLTLPEPIEFLAGQYAQVIMGERDKRPFSIASCPSKTEQLELHIGATADNRYAMEVLDKMRATGEVRIEVPLGNAWYREDSERPLILIAGGTGFSYTWSILQAHLRSNSTRPITLYWGGRKPEDLYLDTQLKKLSDQHANMHYCPVVEQAPETWHGAQGLVHNAVMAEQSDLNEADIYVAGRFEMVRVIRDAFHAQGLPLSQLYGDALAFI